MAIITYGRDQNTDAPPAYRSDFAPAPPKVQKNPAVIGFQAPDSPNVFRSDLPTGGFPTGDAKQAAWNQTAANINPGQSVFDQAVKDQATRVAASASASAWSPSASNIPEGYDLSKWLDVGHTSPKYVFGRAIASGLDLASAAKLIGATVLGNDTIRLPSGEVIDVWRDFGGAHRQQFTSVGGGPPDPAVSGAGTGASAFGSGDAAGLGAAGSGDASGAGGAGGGDPFGTAGYNGTNYGNSSSTDLYVQQILSRLMELRRPLNDPFRGVANTTALQQVAELLKDQPYTAGEDAALTAHYREPLTQARDAALERNAEYASARGFGSAHGGIANIPDRRTEAAYAQAMSQGANDLAVHAIDEKRSRHTQALSTLNQLMEQERQRRSEENAQSSSLLQTAALLPGLDESRARLLLDATSDQGSSINAQLQSLMSLANQNRSSSAFQDAQNSQDDAAIGSAIARILASMGNG